MAEYVDFHYMPLEGKITGKQVLKQTEDAINDLGQHVYEIDIDNEKIQEAIDTSNQAIDTAEAALSAVTTNRAMWFNTVAEMKATDIALGITAATRGKGVFNDGDGAFYAVREIKGGDVDSDDTVFLDNSNVAERIKQFNLVAKGNNIVYVANIADLRTSDAVAGLVYGTTGYYVSNDGGAGVYTIRNATPSDVDDGGSIIVLDNGNVAELITDGTVNVKQFGAKGDGVTDDLTAIKNAIAFGNTIVFAKGTYIVTMSTFYNGIYISKNCVIVGNSATIKLATSDTSKDVIRAENCTLKLYDLILDANSYGDEVYSGNCLRLTDCEFFGINLEMNNASHHNLVVNGGHALFNGIYMKNCGTMATSSFVYASHYAETQWTNVYVRQDTFDFTKQGQAFYLHNGKHEISNLYTYQVVTPFDARNGSTVVNNGYFYKSGGFIAQTSDESESANIIATNLVYDEVAALSANTQNIIHIASVQNLTIQNCVMRLSQTLQDLVPNNFAFLMKFDRGATVGNKVIGSVRIDGLNIIGDNVCANCIYVRNVSSDSDIKLINCNFPTLTNANAYLGSLYNTVTCHLYFENVKLKTINNWRQVTLYDSASASNYENYTYIADVPQRGTTAERPLLPKVCTSLYYDTDLSKLMCWNGTSWVEVTTS